MGLGGQKVLRHIARLRVVQPRWQSVLWRCLGGAYDNFALASLAQTIKNPARGRAWWSLDAI